MDTRREFAVDAIVFGAGPAGAATALSLMQLGRSVVLVEQKSRLSKAGEGLPGAASPELRALGLWDQFLKQGHLHVWSIKSAWGSDELASQDLTFHPYGQNYHLDREAFDALCIGAAMTRGAFLVRGAITQTVRQSDGRWQLKAHEHKTPIIARFVVDATGCSAAFARRRGEVRLRHDRLVGLRATFPDSQPCGTIPFTLLEAAPDGWWYVARLPRNLVTAVYMTDADLVPPGRMELQSFWKSKWSQTVHVKSHADPVGPPSVSVSPSESALLTEVNGEGWLAVGDAACSFDPLSSLGLCNALESGRWAASAIDREMQGDASALSMYGAQIKTQFAEFDRLRLGYYAAEQRWPTSSFWAGRHQALCLRNAS